MEIKDSPYYSVPLQKEGWWMESKRRKKGQGYMRQNSRTSWNLTISLGRVKGKRIRKYKTVYVKTRKEAEKELDLFIKENTNNQIKNSIQLKIKKQAKLELYDFCKNCNEYCFVKNSKLNEKYRYNNDCKAYQFYLFRIN